MRPEVQNWDTNQIACYLDCSTFLYFIGYLSLMSSNEDELRSTVIPTRALSNPVRLQQVPFLQGISNNTLPQIDLKEECDLCGV